MALSSRKKAAITLLVEGHKLGRVSELIGVSSRTLWSWRHTDEPFMGELEVAQTQALRDARGQLKAASRRAVERLHEILDDHLAPHASQVSAARTILDVTFKHVELEVLGQRMEEIEAALRDPQEQES